ncbi:hypothetical protein BDN71DRAFT_1482593 [Pleurotus eryngii]|uniref:Uncharacterized protein n=1 Tax=Pleurotus eryngii TaxID=5323 RepID=A0A9P6D7C7_PLEER|nr:hypothetical protein BDN71DRAFT_1482593 [Pleurotus eryngii]
MEASANNLDDLFTIWGLSETKATLAPFTKHQDLYNSIDESSLDDTPWKCLSITSPGGISGDLPNLIDDIPSDISQWKTKPYEVWYQDPMVVLRNMLDNPDFHPEFDYAPYIELDAARERRWSNFMLANFAWRQCMSISNENPQQNNGAMYCPIILGSDKTTVSVATRQVEYHPLYMSIGNIHNNVCHAHRQGLVLIAFLAIPKANHIYDNDVKFRKFKCQLYHLSISAIFQSVLPYMTKPIVFIFDFGAFIGDYPEQVMLSGIVQGWCARCTALCTDLDGADFARCQREHLTDTLVDTLPPAILWDKYSIDSDIIPFTNDFPCANIHKIMTPDLLHQIIKGTFKDHLVSWVGIYLVLKHGKSEAATILDEIDHQDVWTLVSDFVSSELKLLSPLRLAAMPSFRGLCRFPDGCQFEQWTGDDLKALMKVYILALVGFVPSEMIHTFKSFLNFCSIAHHTYLIQEFGAPNGICSLITESQHINAVKKPWQRSSCWNALGQMLHTNQHLDKLATMQADFVECAAVLQCSPTIDLQDDEDCAPVDNMVEGSAVFAQTWVKLHECPLVTSKISVFHSAVATFFAPSDNSGTQGMRRVCIHSTPSWQDTGHQHDCALVVEDATVPGFQGMSVLCIYLLFSFKHLGQTIPCTLVQWFK